MKRTLAILITTVFVGSSMSQPAIAAVKPGISCKKLGQTSISSGKKFTCIKIGKKLIWDKGQVVSLALPMPSLTPLPTQSQASTIEKTASVPQSSPLGMPISKSDAMHAFNEFQKVTTTSNRISLKWEIGTINDQDFRKKVVEITNKALFKYTAFLTKNYEVTAYIYSELDLDKVNANPILKGQSDTYRIFDWYAKDKNIRNNSVGIAGHTYFTSCKDYPTDCNPTFNAAGSGYPSYSNLSNQNEGNLTTISHELFHVLQDIYLFENQGSKFLSEENLRAVSPTLFREGLATFAQCASSFDEFSSYELCLGEKREWMKKDSPISFQANTIDKMSHYLSSLQVTQATAPHYFLGAVFFEWLINRYGTDKLIQLVQSHSRSKDFGSLFLSIYGQKLDDAYVDSADYLIKRMTNA